MVMMKTCQELEDVDHVSMLSLERNNGFQLNVMYCIIEAK